jgi:hypothetical protein
VRQTFWDVVISGWARLLLIIIGHAPRDPTAEDRRLRSRPPVQGMADGGRRTTGRVGGRRLSERRKSSSR